MKRTCLTLITAAGLVSAAGVARAQVACDDTNTLKNPIYITGSTALEPMLKQIGPKLAADATTPRTIVYLKDGSCSGVARLSQGGKVTQNMLYLPPTYDPNVTASPPSCTIPAAGITPTLVLSDVDPKLCPGSPALSGITDAQGPVNDMVIVVPPDSTAKAVSAEMLYLIFGKGTDGQVNPFTNPMYFFIRTPDSGTRAMINANIGVGAHPWQGSDGTNFGGTKAFGSGDVLAKTAAQNTTANRDATLGILGQDFYDSSSGGVSNRNQVKALPFRAFKQEKAFWPDSTLTARDRKNVREGRYKIWGYVHMLIASTGADANAQYFVDLLAGKQTATGFSTLDQIIASHLTPVCAMKVTHDLEGGEQKPFKPTNPCGCYFESKATNNPTPAGCTACTGTGQGSCAVGQVCSNGFCEAQ